MDDLGSSFSQRYINGYRTEYFLALRQVCLPPLGASLL